MTVVSIDGPGDDGAVNIDRCPQCGGTFLEFFDGEPIGLAQGAIGEAPQISAPPPAATVTCPDCESAMVERAYLGEGPMLARCDTCMAVFVSRDRLGQLASMTVRPAEVGAEPGWIQRLVSLFD